MKKGYHKMPDGTIMKDSDHMKKYKHGGSASHGNKKAHSRSKPAGNSGLYGRVQRKQGGGDVRGPGDPETLSDVQRNMLAQAQQYAQQTGQNPAEVQRLTGIYGDQTGASNTPAPTPPAPPMRRPPVQSGPALPPSAPMPPGRGTAGGPSAPGGRMPGRRSPDDRIMMAGTLGGGPGGLGSAGPGGELRRRAALQRGPGRRPPMTGGRMPQPPMGGRMPEPRLPGGGRLRPPVMGPEPDAGRMSPRRMESIGQSIRDALGLGGMGGGRSRPPMPRRGRPSTGGRTPPPMGRGRGRGPKRPTMTGGPRGRGRGMER